MKEGVFAHTVREQNFRGGVYSCLRLTLYYEHLISDQMHDDGRGGATLSGRGVQSVLLTLSHDHLISDQINES